MEAKTLVGIIILLAVLILLITLVTQSGKHGNDNLDKETENKCKSGFLSIFLKNSEECETQNEESGYSTN